MSADELVLKIKELTDKTMEIVNTGVFSSKQKHQVLREVRVQLLNIRQALNNFTDTTPMPPAGEKQIA